MADQEEVKSLLGRLTLREKAALCSGKDFWFLKGVEKLGLPEMMLTDGPHGLRKQAGASDHVGLSYSVPATCFPTASANACSFDPELLEEVGKAIGEECRQEDVGILLGPGVNMKRSPLCGRNFEYFSEDPLLAGELAAGFIRGLQGQHVGASIKHFAVNNQEKRRMVVDAVVDERTLREIYLKAFEIAVKKSHPWTVMCSYNRVKGEFASQNPFLLTQVLRREWGFDGVVISDWGATVDRVKALKAGLDIEMPHTDEINDARVKQAVEDGVLAESLLDETAERVIEMMLKAREREPLQYDTGAHHSLAARVATESAVLLKNEGGILPGSRDARAAVIGVMAKESRYQGAGNSRIAPLRLDNAWDELKALGLKAEYAEGYCLDANEEDEGLMREACRVAQGKDIVYLFAGLPDRYEAESFDRASMAMPENQNRLIEAVSEVNPNLVVVLMGGAPMELPWADKARAILLMYLGGEACGQACATLLLGKSTPSGKLAETWPMKVEDNPSFPYFPGYPLTVEYREGPFIGYRYYDSAGVKVRFPFGFGLSYTSFGFRELSVSKESLEGLGDEVHVRCKVKNIGGRAGKEVVQVYVHWKDSRIIRPEQELKGFAKVALEAGEEKEVDVILTGADLAYYNVEKGAWALEEGTVEIRVGAGSRDIRLSAEVKVKGTPDCPPPDLRKAAPCYYDLSAGLDVSDAEFEALLGRPIPARERVKGTPHTTVSTFTDIQDRWLGRRLIALLRSQIDKMPENAEDVKMMAQNMLMDAPLHFVTMMEGRFTTNQVEGLVDLLNGKMVRGLIKLLMKASR